MTRGQLELDSEILARAERLARLRGITTEQLLSELIQQAEPIESATDRALGLFMDEPELMDRVVEGALCSREEQPLRLPH